MAIEPQTIVPQSVFAEHLKLRPNDTYTAARDSPIIPHPFIITIVSPLVSRMQCSGKSAIKSPPLDAACSRYFAN